MADIFTLFMCQLTPSRLRLPSHNYCLKQHALCLHPTVKDLGLTTASGKRGVSGTGKNTREAIEIMRAAIYGKFTVSMGKWQMRHAFEH